MSVPSSIRFITSQLWSLVADRSTIVSIACALGIWIQFEYRVPGPFLFLLLPAVGVALLVLNLYFLISHHLARMRADDPFRLTLGRIEWWSSLLVRVFVYYSLLLYVNGKLDTSKPTYQPYDIVSLAKKFDSGTPLAYSWVFFRHRENPEQTERVLIRSDELRNLSGAEPVAVTIRQGFVGIPWVGAIERDWDHYGRQILKLAPTAAIPWKELITFNFNHDRWKQAMADANEYVKRYPSDLDFILYVAGALLDEGQYKEGIPFLEFVIAKRPTYDVYQTLGWAFSYAGNNPRAAQVLEASVQLNPDYWEAYYHLGYVYGGMGKFVDGIAMFEKTLERNPNMPEVEIELKRLKEELAVQQAATKRRMQTATPSPSAPR